MSQTINFTQPELYKQIILAGKTVYFILRRHNTTSRSREENDHSWLA